MNPLDSDDDDSIELSPIKAEFELAAKFLRGVTGQLKPDQLLYLYARYKQSVDGPCNVPRPGFFDFQGKQKWDAWNSLGQMSADTAMTEYTAFISEHFPSFRDDVSGDGAKKSSGSAFGARVSTMSAPDGGSEDEHTDESGQVFAWFKAEGLSSRVKHLIDRQPDLATSGVDSAGQTLLHWAADRADSAACRSLLDLGADPNRPDCDGMTALHSAVASTASTDSVISVVKMLVASGGRFQADDFKPEDLTENAQVLELLAGANLA